MVEQPTGTVTLVWNGHARLHGHRRVHAAPARAGAGCLPGGTHRAPPHRSGGLRLATMGTRSITRATPSSTRSPPHQRRRSRQPRTRDATRSHPTRRGRDARSSSGLGTGETAQGSLLEVAVAVCVRRGAAACLVGGPLSVGEVGETEQRLGRCLVRLVGRDRSGGIGSGVAVVRLSEELDECGRDLARRSLDRQADAGTELDDAPALNCWSRPSGSRRRGFPWARARSVVPSPPCVMTALQRGSR